MKVCFDNRRYTILDFENEVKHLMRLQPHKNIIEFVGFYHRKMAEQENVWHIVTEYMPGGTLEMLCKEKEVPSLLFFF